MDKKEELLHILDIRRSQYSDRILLKGMFFHFEDYYYPVKLFFIPINDNNFDKDSEFDYGDFLLIKKCINADNLKEVINSLGEEADLKILSPHKIKIPRGYFRDIEENQNEISKLYGGWISLSDTERELFRETRSFPKSLLRQWPSNVYLFHCRMKNEYRNLYYDKFSKPLPLQDNLPMLPDYNSAINWWFGEELYISDGAILFYIPDFSVRIKSVKFTKDRFIVIVEEGTLTKDNLIGKYYVKYENIPPETGEVSFSGNAEISIKDKVNRFYIVLCSKKEPTVRIDYRNYYWDSYGDRKDFDIEIEEENIEYWVTSGENENVEFKLLMEEDKDNKDKNNKEFLETVCSFSNTDGGLILIGVDDNGNVKGLSENNIESYQQKIPSLIRNWIEPQVKPKIKTIDFKGKKIIAVNISKGSNQPYNYKDHGIYIRTGSTDRIATRDEVLSLVPRDTNNNMYDFP